MKISSVLTLLIAVMVFPGFAASSEKILLQAEDAALHPERAEIVEQSSFKSGKGASLKPGVNSAVDIADAAPDLVFRVQPAAAGRFVMVTHAAVDADGRKLMEKAKTKHESLFMLVVVGDSRPTKRVVFVPWSEPDSCKQTTGKFDLVAQEQDVRIWLPEGVRLDYVELSPYVPPAVPAAVANYRPKIVPPSSHPRLWVNEQSLPQVRANLTKGENAKIWKEVQDAARKPFDLQTTPGVGIGHDSELEAAAVNKAFVYLMIADEKSGREAVELVHEYLGAVEFGNLLDITREIGRAMYAGARVYDWCYDLMSEEERRDIRLDMMRLADDMEIGWPPFLQGVVNGHGSEAQLHCHLLSMAIAIYNEDPVPYQYCSYRVLEELVPMRNFEYQSPRHNQGIGYGIYRFGWDMHAAWLFYRMSGKKVFERGIEDVSKYWIYMRLPDGHSFPDGDGNVDGRRVNLGQTALLAGAYANDPVMKRDFIRQGGLPYDPIMVLLLNDPNLAPADDLSSLPLTLDFGPVLGGMVARTGWSFNEGSSDVVVAMTGGGYNFGNHQHSDAGSFQLYYHGNQVVDLGQYVFYGTPYDMNFNKRSVAHSMMLAYDPGESFGSRLNDGGTRFEHVSPRSPEMVQSDPRFVNGTVVSADFGPSDLRPSYSYFSVDLTSAYSNKIRNYVRTFCFLNLENEDTPAALIVLDNMETSGPEVKKYWQVNTLNPPKPIPEGVLLSSSDSATTGFVSVQMLRPEAEDRQLNILSGKEANSVFGHELQPPKLDAPQANGHRVTFSPAKAQTNDTFLTVLTMVESKQTTLPVHVTETDKTFALSLADRVVVLSKSGGLLKDGFTVEAPADGNNNVVLTGLTPGTWKLTSSDGKVQKSMQVGEKKNTAFVMLPKGRYTLTLNL